MILATMHASDSPSREHLGVRSRERFGLDYDLPDINSERSERALHALEVLRDSRRGLRQRQKFDVFQFPTPDCALRKSVVRYHNDPIHLYASVAAILAHNRIEVSIVELPAVVLGLHR